MYAKILSSVRVYCYTKKGGWKLGRKMIDRSPIFRMLALNWDKRKIKRETKVSERTYWLVKAEWDKLSEAEREEIKRSATEEEKAKARFEDYELVQKWVVRMESERIKSRRGRLNLCRKIWLILQKKNPENWTIDDIKLRAIPELRKTTKSVFNYLIAVRSLRPDFKFPDEKGETLSTKREKGKISFAWKYIYQRIVQEGLVQKFFESARIDSENPLRDEGLVRTHVTLGCREGSRGEGGVLGLEWEKINWKAKTIDVYEGKTGGGFYWLDCPLDLFGDTCFNLLEEYWVQCGKPREGKIYPMDYQQLKAIYDRIAKALDMNIHPHFARKLHASLLRSKDIKLEIVAGDAPHGIVGVGWEDLSTLKKFYIAFAQEDIQKTKEKARELAL